ncbi:MAG: DUF4258 domain-containing protein [Candidatus Azambacteria bacterium]|nr:DUF4258 domain-containing protein [Candidatus Azambacteria bacterium]
MSKELSMLRSKTNIRKVPPTPPERGFGRFKAPKNDEKLTWTMHIVQKMMYYGISEGLVRRVINTPTRVEEGVAPGTTAVMQPTGGKHKKEVWVMYQPLKVKTKSGKPKLHVITAWRYPGVSPVRSAIPIPHDILLELIGGGETSCELPQ